MGHNQLALHGPERQKADHGVETHRRRSRTGNAPVGQTASNSSVTLVGPGKVWVSQGAFQVVDPKKIPVTYAAPLTRVFNNKDLRKLPLEPVNLDFEK